MIVMREPTDMDDGPVTRSQVQTSIRIGAEALRTWVLFAVALVSLHVVQFGLLHVPWTEREGSRGAVSSGWEIVGNNVPGDAWIVLSVLLLLASTVASFQALRHRSAPIFSMVAVLTVLRMVAVVGASRSATAAFDFRFTRYGVALTMWFLVITLIVALVAAVFDGLE